MELIFPTIEWKQAALEFRQEHFDIGETIIHGDGGLDDAETYEIWLKKIQADLTRNDGTLVPATQFFAVVEGKIVGAIQIRHKLNDFLLNYGGHIGYGVRPTQRRKGHATKMLALALEKCREIGIEKVLLTCDKGNISSAKTMTNNGGVLENEIAHDNGNITQRYWIIIK